MTAEEVLRAGSRAAITEGDFEELLISEAFGSEYYESTHKQACFDWLESRPNQIYIWIDSYISGGPELHQRLLELRENMAELYGQINNLCSGPRSYLSIGEIYWDQTSKDALKEYREAHSSLEAHFHSYLIFGKAWDKAYETGELLDVDRPGLKPDELEQGLMERLHLIQSALNCLAGTLHEPLIGGP